MVSAKELNRFYDAILNAPGMVKNVKINFRVPCKTVLFMVKAIELGLLTKGNGDNSSFLISANEETIEGIRNILTEILQQAELTDTYQNMNSFEQNK